MGKHATERWICGFGRKRTYNAGVCCHPVVKKCDNSGDSIRNMRGRVVYVHPKGRFAVLEFPGISGTEREAFWPEELTAENRRKP